jgi:hypothetical protein
MKIGIQIFLLCGIIACNYNSKTTSENSNNTEQTNTITDSTPVVYRASKQAASIFKEQTINWDTIKFDSLNFPNDTNLPAQILFTGNFHSDEVCQGADKINWFGVFKNNSGYYLANTKITTARVNDIGDEDDEKTGWEIQTLNKDTSILLLSGLGLSVNRQFTSVDLSQNTIWPGDSLTIKYLGESYVLYATGGKIKVQESPVWYQAYNYKLYISTIKNGQLITQLLVAKSRFNDQIVDIPFAGDIDGDGILDLLIDVSDHYNVTSPTLYLSKPTDNKQILKVVAQSYFVGC